MSVVLKISLKTIRPHGGTFARVLDKQTGRVLYTSLVHAWPRNARDAALTWIKRTYGAPIAKGVNH